MAENKNQNPPMVDPIAYRPDYNAVSGSWVPLQNADVNINQYWDDSSAANYNNPELWGWTNTKYTGETTKNSQVAYNPNLTIDQLDPNYKYGQEAQIANSKQANYIAQRNDNIASALYNAGTTSIEDVENFLNQQAWFFNSNPNERENTKTAIFKRLGDLQKQQQQPEQTEKKDVSWDMQQLLWQEQNKLFGKVTADTWEPMQGIDTLSDGYAINQQMIQSRINKINALQNMNPIEIAALVKSGTTPYGETAMRDWKRMDPEGYAKFEQELNNSYDQDKVDSLTHGAATEETKSFIESVDKGMDNDSLNWIKENSTDRNFDQVSSLLNDKLRTNQMASSAKEEMMNIKADIADIEAEIDDLPRQAREAFKSDVPEYLVQAFISNNQQRLQRELNKLQSRYSWLADIYKTEVSNTQWELEYQLKKDQLAMDRTKMNFDMAYKQAQLEQDSIKWDSKGNAYTIRNGQVIQLENGTAYAMYQGKVNTMIQQFEQMAEANALYGQCEQFTDDAAEDAAWVRMVWAGGRAETTSDEKNWYATQFNLFSDYIPEVWDIAVFDYRDASWASNDSKTYWHTMYVAGYDPSTQMIHLIGSNGNGDLANKVYSKDISLQDFYAKYWKWFWNPYKYAQWQNMQYNGTSSQYSPMQAIIDAHMKDASMGMLANLGTFQEIYTNLYNADKDWQLSAMLQQWAIGTFLNNVALQWAQSQGWDGGQISDDNSVTKFFRLTAAEAIAEAENYMAQNGWFKNDPEAQKAYAWFLTMMRAVEIKLRDESGAAINQSERATNFLQYLPKAWDSDYIKSSKLKNMEQYIRRLGTDAWITSSEYIPLNLGTMSRKV